MYEKQIIVLMHQSRKLGKEAREDTEGKMKNKFNRRVKRRQDGIRLGVERS